ncbi:putative ribonuclease H-like domain-containing protein, partial [Tanacetum coccineum]
FETRFVPQTELSVEQAFWSQNSMNSLDPTPSCKPTKVECLKLETELLNKKDFVEKEIYDKLLRSYTTLEKHCMSLEVDTQLNQEIFQRDNSVSNQSALSFDQYFELNKLKAQSQEKDTVIKKLKERIKSLSGNMNEDKIKKDIEEIETINIELDNMVSKLITENEHLKQTFKQLYDSIKPIRKRFGHYSLLGLKRLHGFLEVTAAQVWDQQTRTPQQNGVVERRNMTLIEAARTMLADSKLPTTFWAEAVNTACYVQNRVLVVKPHNKTPYELFRRRTPALSFMRPFGCHVTILNILDYLGKFDGKFLEDKPIIVGDGPKWLFDIDVLTKSINYVPVVADGSLFDSSLKNASNDEPQPSSDAGKKDDEGVNKESGIDGQKRPENITTAPLKATHSDFFGDETEIDMSNITATYLVPSTPNTRIHKDPSLDHVIGDVQSGVQTRRMTKTTNEQGFISAVYEGKTPEDIHTCLFTCFLSQEEPKKGYTQEEGIDYVEVFTPVARIEAIRLFLAYASFKDFIVYQMDVKSAFLYGKIEKEVYVCQPLGFEDLEFPDKLYKVEKALYGLHQAPRAWYETLFTYLLDNRFQRGQIDKTLFIKRVKSDILLVQVYVDDIIFGSTKKKLCTEFEKLMHKKFQMNKENKNIK